MGEDTSVRTARRRVHARRLLETETQRPRVALKAERAVAQLERLLSRAKIVSRRGRKASETPLFLSFLERQALEECLELMKLKVAMQRGDVPLRSRTDEGR